MSTFSVMSTRICKLFNCCIVVMFICLLGHLMEIVSRLCNLSMQVKVINQWKVKYNTNFMEVTNYHLLTGRLWCEFIHSSMTLRSGVKIYMYISQTMKEHLVGSTVYNEKYCVFFYIKKTCFGWLHYILVELNISNWLNLISNVTIL